MTLPKFSPADLKRLPESFDHDDFIFELKMDGFRALAYVAQDETRLVSRKGNPYKSFLDLCAAIHLDLDCEAVLDGEIVVLDEAGRPQFYELLRRRGEPVFYVFDILWLKGQDLRFGPSDRAEAHPPQYRSRTTIGHAVRPSHRAERH